MNKLAFSNKNKSISVALKFDYFTISQYRDLHFKEINIVLNWPGHSRLLNLCHRRLNYTHLRQH